MAQNFCQIDDALKCPICMDVFDTPKMLECKHSYCLECIFKTYEGNYKIGEVHKVICPVCRYSHKFKKLSKGVHQLTLEDLNLQLPDNDFVLEIKHNVNELSKNFNSLVLSSFVTNNDESGAHSCLCGSHSAWLCPSCTVSLCNECLGEHCEAHPEHEVVNLKERISNCICNGKATWHCKTCDTPLCISCFPDHLEAFDKHELHEVTVPPKPLKRTKIDVSTDLCTIWEVLLNGKEEIETTLNSARCEATCDMAVIRKIDGSIIADTKSLNGKNVDTNAQELKVFFSSLPKFPTTSFGSKFLTFESKIYSVKMKLLKNTNEEIFTGISDGAGFMIKHAGVQYFLFFIFKGQCVDEKFLDKFVQ